MFIRLGYTLTHMEVKNVPSEDYALSPRNRCTSMLVYSFVVGKLAKLCNFKCPSYYDSDARGVCMFVSRTVINSP